jgi:hypothetical protein
MPTQVQRKPNENSERMLARFNKTCMRNVKKMRYSRFRADSASPLKKKQIAIIGAKYRAERERRKFYA